MSRGKNIIWAPLLKLRFSTKCQLLPLGRHNKLLNSVFMCWLSKRTQGWWKRFAKGHSGYSALLQGIGALMLGFCWYELRHTLTAMLGDNVAWRVWIRKSKPCTVKGLSNNKRRQSCNDFCRKRGTVDVLTLLIKKQIYITNIIWSKKLSENVRIHHRQA